MARPHEEILKSLPAERLRVGDYIVDPTTREIARGDMAIPTRVSVKSMDVLLMLAAHEGKVVGRQALLDAIWPSTLPTDEVVTQAVAQLRRAFGDGKPAEYIETISKHGYRLKAPVQWLMPPRTPVAANDEVPPSKPLSSLRWAAGLVIAVFALVAGYLLLRQQAPSTRTGTTPAQAGAERNLTVERLTSRPGMERWAAPSPDGSVIAYSEIYLKPRATRLMVQATASAQPTALTELVEGRIDTMPAWSPDGREILFQRIGSEQCHFMLIPATGGEPRRIGSCMQVAGPVSWSPDGRRLAVTYMGASRGSSSIHLLDAQSGRIDPLAYEHSPYDEDTFPVFSPDGKWIVFQRSISRGDLWRVPSVGGKPQRLTSLETNFYGFSWLPDGRTLVFSRYLRDTPVLATLDVMTGNIRDLGVREAEYPYAARHSPIVTFILSSAPGSLYQATVGPGTAASGQSAPTQILASTTSELLPSVSPDGRQLVFASDRSGRTELWWVELERPGTLRRIKDFEPVLRHIAAWSEQGDRVLIVGRDGDRERLAEISVAEGHVRWLPTVAEGTPVQAAYVPGERNAIVMVVDTGEGRLAAIRYDTRGATWRPETRLDDIASVRADYARSRLLLVRSTRLGVLQSDPRLASPSQLDSLTGRDGGRLIPGGGFFNQSRRLVTWAGGAAVLGADKACPVRWLPLPYRPETRGPCIDIRLGTMLGASYDPSRGRLYYGYSTEQHDDVGWLSLAP